MQYWLVPISMWYMDIITSSVLHSTGSEDMNLKSGLFKQNWTQSMALYLLLICPSFFLFLQALFPSLLSFSPLLCLLPSEGLAQILGRLHQCALPTKSSEGTHGQGEEFANCRLRPERGGQKEKRTKKCHFPPITYRCQHSKNKNKNHGGNMETAH